MSLPDPQKTWDEYYERKKAERLREAGLLWQSLMHAGVTDETVLALDFVLFGTSRQDVQALADQLVENYTVEVVESADQHAWLSKGTTRPYGIMLTQEQHLAWVTFMAEVARSHACVFSAWSIEAPSLKVKVDSEHVEGDA